MAAKMFAPNGLSIPRAGETQETISAWAVETFGEPKNVFALVNRANTEMGEALREANLAAIPGMIETPIEAKLFATEIIAECADVLICLYQVAEYCGIDLQGAVDQKMNINRKRQWNVHGDGTGQHTELAASIPALAPGMQSPDHPTLVAGSGQQVAPACSIGECGDALADTAPVESLPTPYKPLMLYPSRVSDWQPREVDRSSLFEPSLSYHRERQRR